MRRQQPFSNCEGAFGYAAACVCSSPPSLVAHDKLIPFNDSDLNATNLRCRFDAVARTPRRARVGASIASLEYFHQV